MISKDTILKVTNRNNGSTGYTVADLGIHRHFSPNETKELMDTIRLVRDRYQITILLIEHDMKLVTGICEKILVLNFGTELASGTPEVVLNNPEVITAYLGE